MSAPEDNSAILTAADAVRAYEYERGARSRDAEVAALTGRLADLQAEYDAYKAAHPAAPTPDPEPQPTPRAPLIGMSAPADVWAQRKQQVEATGGKLQARRLFFQSLTEDPTSVLGQCAREGLAAVLSFKPGSYSWAQIADGSADAALKALANRVKAHPYPVFLTISHEPGKQSLGPAQGEAGSAADFGRMLARLSDVVKAIAPAVKTGPIMNGWMWSAQNRGYSDAEFNVWLPAATLAKCDFVAADDYNSEGSTEKAVTRIKRRTAWTDRVGFTGAAGVGETNAYTPADLTSVFDLAKTDPHFEGGFVLVWNSTGESYRPLTETGLLDDFQSILAGWPKS